MASNYTVRPTRTRGWSLPSGGFINVDLEISAPFDLEPLRLAIEPRLVVLHSEIGARRSYIRAESLVPDPRNAEHAILDISRVLSRLRGISRSLWLLSPHRVIDIGYSAGSVPLPFVDLIGAQAIAGLGRLGVQLAVTIYRTNPAGDRSSRQRKRSNVKRHSA